MKLLHFRLVCAAVATSAIAVSQTTFNIQPSPNPNASGNALSGIFAVSPSDIWAVGFQNANSSFNNGALTLIEHFDGTAWSVIPSPSPNPGRCQGAGFELNAVSAVTSQNAWAVGTRNVNSTCNFLINPLILHWDGNTWRTISSPMLSTNGNNELLGVIAFATGDTYAVGFQSGPRSATFTLVEHWDGSKWSVMKSPNLNSTGNYLNAISGTSPADLWAVGDLVAPNTPVLTLTEHFDGFSWVAVPSPSPQQASDLDQNVLVSATSVSPSDVYAVGHVLNAGQQTDTTLIEHWNGTAWSVMPSRNVSNSPGSVNILTGATAVSNSDVYAVGYFSNSATSGQPQTLIEHFDGVSWSIIPSPSKPLASQLFGATALPSTGQIWIAGAFSPFGFDTEFGFLQIPRTLVLSADE